MTARRAFCPASIWPPQLDLLAHGTAHGTRFPESSATETWDNAFSLGCRRFRDSRGATETPDYGLRELRNRRSLVRIQPGAPLLSPALQAFPGYLTNAKCLRGCAVDHRNASAAACDAYSVTLNDVTTAMRGAGMVDHDRALLRTMIEYSNRPW
jgi:hypothetical protein